MSLPPYEKILFEDLRIPQEFLQQHEKIINDKLRQAAAEAERDMAGLSMSVFRAPAEKADLERYAEAGVARAVFRLPSATRDTVLPLLDEYATLMN